MKLVLDANIYISSFFWGGNPRRIIERIISGKDLLFVSKEILTEVFSVMSRPKFDMKEEHISRFINSIEEIAFDIKLTDSIQNVCRDKDDDKIIECAVLANADYIITGDDDLLTIKEFRGTKIITANEYINILKTN